MNRPIATYVHGVDPISRAGVISQLRACPEVFVVGEMDVDQASVAVYVTDTVDDEATRTMRALRRGDAPRLVLVATVLDEAALVAAAEVGVGGLLRRVDATPEALVRTIVKVAAGEGEIPADLLGRLMDQLGR